MGTVSTCAGFRRLDLSVKRAAARKDVAGSEEEADGSGKACLESASVLGVVSVGEWISTLICSTEEKPGISDIVLLAVQLGGSDETSPRIDECQREGKRVGQDRKSLRN